MGVPAIIATMEASGCVAADPFPGSPGRPGRRVSAGTSELPARRPGLVLDALRGHLSTTCLTTVRRSYSNRPFRITPLRSPRGSRYSRITDAGEAALTARDLSRFGGLTVDGEWLWTGGAGQAWSRVNLADGRRQACASRQRDDLQHGLLGPNRRTWDTRSWATCLDCGGCKWKTRGGRPLIA